jgi:hypothetical protein
MNHNILDVTMAGLERDLRCPIPKVGWQWDGCGSYQGPALKAHKLLILNYAEIAKNA